MKNGKFLSINKIIPVARIEEVVDTSHVFMIIVFMSLISNYITLFLCSSKLKTKMYIALQSLELDLTKMMHMFR